jgi:hypothetical protein
MKKWEQKFNPPNQSRDCEHGNLARSCQICELEHRVFDYELENQVLTNKLLLYEGATNSCAQCEQAGKRIEELKVSGDEMAHALEFIEVDRRENCDGSIGWRSQPEAIAGDELKVKHVLAAEKAIKHWHQLTNQPKPIAQGE